MESQPLRPLCLPVVQQLAQEQSWNLPPAGVTALVDAILPFLSSPAKPTVHLIRTVATNYFLDGPMVQQMLAPNSARGEQLWLDWRSQVLKVARHKGLTAEEADDLVQAVYLQTAKALRTFHFQARVKTYFYSIFHKHFAKWLQTKNKVETTPLESDVALPTALIDTQSTEQVENAEIQDLVRAEIQKIVNSIDFQILYLFYGEESEVDPATGGEKKWTDKTIGEKLNMALNTVTSRRLRALQRLRQNPRLAELFRGLLYRAGTESP